MTKKDAKKELKKAGLVTDEKEAVKPIIEKKLKKEFRIKEVAKGEYGVLNGMGKVIRVYKKQDGCNDPKKSAESYAKKLAK